MNNNKFRYVKKIEGLPNAGLTLIPTELSFDGTTCILKNFSITIQNSDGTKVSGPIIREDRIIDFKLRNSGEIEITTSKDESSTTAIVVIEYDKI